MLKAGTQAPDFELPNQNGETIRLRDYKGQTVIVYFYPKDNTPGCTKEACSIRDSHADMRNLNAVVLGISKDSIESHSRFAQKHELPFHLLSDEDMSVMQAYGAWGEKKFYGKTSMGVLRSTFVIDKDGIIEKVYARVKTDTHGADLLAYLSSRETI
ncbi:MAG: thioredoxin-dependent thiol peroxidase [Christensenellales bacterium]|jgi:peroxiredoxin Q/BCP